MIQVKNLTITHRKDMRVILESFSMVLNDGDKAALINDVRRGKTHTLSEWREFMIQVKNLTITHRKDMRVILESFSMVLNDGDKAALIGEEGNGKSTLLKLLYDERLVEDYAEYSGEIIKNRARIGYLAQELTEEQKAQSVYEFCAQSDVFYEQSPKELAAIAGQLGLSSDIFYADQRMGQLSGGEKVKLQLARLLMEQPDVLFLDEPSNDIDIETIDDRVVGAFYL